MSVCNSRTGKTGEAKNSAKVSRQDTNESSVFMPTFSKLNLTSGSATGDRVNHKEYIIDHGYVSRFPDDLPHIKPIISVDYKMCKAVSQRFAKALPVMRDTSVIAFAI